MRSVAAKAETAIAKPTTGADSWSVSSPPIESLASASSLRTQQTRRVSSNGGAAGARGEQSRQRPRGQQARKKQAGSRSRPGCAYLVSVVVAVDVCHKDAHGVHRARQKFCAARDDRFRRRSGTRKQDGTPGRCDRGRRRTERLRDESVVPEWKGASVAVGPSRAWSVGDGWLLNQRGSGYRKRKSLRWS